MKKLSFLILMSFFWISVSLSQEDPKSLKKVVKEETVNKYIDKNGDGINDNLQMERKGNGNKVGQMNGEKRGQDMKNKNDMFIDADGDGICDFRSGKGMGLSMKNRMGMMNRGLMKSK